MTRIMEDGIINTAKIECLQCDKVTNMELSLMPRPINLKSYEDALSLWKQLQQVFPKCFFSIGQEKPLKVGIFHELVARRNELSPVPDKKLIRAFMMIYTSSIHYRAALIKSNAIRVDLDGNQFEPVTAKERYKAKVTTRKIVWALETEGYEAELAKAKAKLKDQVKQPKETVKKIPKETIKKEAAHPKDKNLDKGKSSEQSLNGSIYKTQAITKKLVPIIVKKKRNILPNDSGV